MGHQHDLSRLQRRAGGDGPDLDLGRTADRPDGRARSDVDWHRHRLRRPSRFVAGRPRHHLPGGLGGDRRRHALLPLRRGVRRAGPGRAEPRARRHLLSHPLRRLRLDGVLGDRPLPERGLRLARHPDHLCGRQPRRLPAAQLVRPVAARAGERRGGGQGARENAGRPGAGGTPAPRRHRALRPHHVAQWFRVRRRVAAARAAAGGGRAGRRDGGVGRLAQGPRPVRRPTGRDFLRAKPQGDDRCAHRHRRPAGRPAAAHAGARRILAARRLHPAARRLAGRDHDRARRRPARAVRRRGLRRGAGTDRDADPAGQCLFANAVRADRRPGRLAEFALRVACLIGPDLVRHRIDVAVVRRGACGEIS